MTGMREKFQRFSKTQLQVAGVIVLILFAAILLWVGNINSMQSVPAMVAQVDFKGEYRIADGDWQPIVPGEHIPSTKGDVTLRGNFHMYTPDGEYVGICTVDTPIALYTDHINLTFFDGGEDIISTDTENSLYGNSACGESWCAHSFTSEDPIEILIHNPHSFGNETAIDEMLSNIAFWAGIEFEKGILDSGDSQRDIGLLFVIVSLMLLGTALFSTLIHLKNTKIIWMFGTVILFAGIYFAYSADGISFWSESVVSNTIILGASMMFYMLFVLMIITHSLQKTQPIGIFAVVTQMVANAVILILPLFTDLYLYDLLLIWTVIQIIANVVLMVCLAREFVASAAKTRWIYIGSFLPLVAFIVDVIGVDVGAWKGGLVSRYVFIALFIVVMIMVLKLIPNNINAATKARELELEKIALNAQLAESRISTMMSQIRPHFIYNTLGSIEQLCILDPPKAGELVHNFAKYLRGNFGELDNPKPIMMSQEMEHVHHYVSIENVRFPDMTFTFEMDSEDFSIPALTVQPIVENAIKHGLMKLPRGGSIRVISYETDTAYHISVVDDGVGFDVNTMLEDRKHVGLRNIRERLKVMVNGSLEIESTPGVGTTVRITIPKEVGR